MKTVTVIRRRTGRPERMQARYADVLVKLGHADYPRRDMQAEGQAENPKPAKKAAKKRTYKRRDMQAEEE